MKTYEAFDTKKKMKFFRYEDIMNTADKNRMNKILDKDTSKWTPEEKEFMLRMSYKDQVLYVGDDQKPYKKEDLIEMGYSPDEIDKSLTKIPPHLDKDIKEIIEEYKKTLYLTKKMLNRYPEEYDLTTKIANVYQHLSKAIRELEK